VLSPPQPKIALDASMVRANTAAAALTVIIFHAADPEVKTAFDAQQVLQQRRCC